MTFGAAGEHALGAALADTMEGLDDRLGAGVARAGVGRDLIAEPEQTGDARAVAARHDLLDHGAAEARDLAGVGLGRELLGDGVDAADAGADHGAGVPVGLGVGRDARQARVGPGVDGRDGRVDHVGIHGVELLVRQVVTLELVHALGNAAHLTAELELGQAGHDSDAALALAQRALKGLEAVSVGRQHAQPSHHHSTFSHAAPPFRRLCPWPPRPRWRE